MSRKAEDNLDGRRDPDGAADVVTDFLEGPGVCVIWAMRHLGSRVPDSMGQLRFSPFPFLGSDAISVGVSRIRCVT